MLGTLKGGAMKFGQALSVYEAAIPDEYAAPYREALTKLQNAAPPMPAATVHRLLAEQFGTGWRGRFRDFDDTAAAAASIGQVHRGVWRDGREVAVKLQYPGAEAALKADLDQLSRVAPLIGVVIPGVQTPAADGRAARAHPRGARLRRRRRTTSGRSPPATPATPTSWCRGSSPAPPKVIVSEWVEGTPLSRIIALGHAPSSATGPARC